MAFSALAAHEVLNGALDDLERELRCPICLDWLENPQQLDVCKHLFCCACLERAFSDASRRICPVCSTPATRRSAVADSFTAELVQAARTTCDALRAGEPLELFHPPPPPPPEQPSTDRQTADRRRYVEQAAARLSHGDATRCQPLQLEDQLEAILELNADIQEKAHAIEQMNASLTRRDP